MTELKKNLEFRFYDMPQKDPVLVFTGEKWRRVYGEGAPNLHFHNVLEIGICREGRGFMQYQDHDEEYFAGEISIIPKNTPHNTMNRPGEESLWEYIFLDTHFYLEQIYGEDPQSLEKTEERINARPNLIMQLAHPEITDAIDGIIREKYETKHYSEEITAAFVMLILFGIARINRPYVRSQSEERIVRSRQIAGALDYIDLHFAEPLTIGELARSAALSETHFRRIFKESVNMTPAEYLNMIRIQRACSMMLKTDDSIEEIARKTGFTTASTFNRNFRTYMNETPLKWKKHHIGHGNNELGISVSALRGWDDDTK